MRANSNRVITGSKQHTCSWAINCTYPNTVFYPRGRHIVLSGNLHHVAERRSFVVTCPRIQPPCRWAWKCFTEQRTGLVGHRKERERERVCECVRVCVYERENREVVEEKRGVKRRYKYICREERKRKEREGIKANCIKEKREGKRRGQNQLVKWDRASSHCCKHGLKYV